MHASLYKIAVVEARETDRRGRGLTSRELIAASIVVLLLVVASVTGYLALNRQLNSATGLVTSYLDALARRDIASVLSIPGVLPDGMSRQEFLNSFDSTLVTASALAPNLRYRIEGVESTGDLHRVLVSIGFGSLPQTTTADSTTAFTVRETAVMGLITQARFEVSPLGSLALTTYHATFFDANEFGPIDIAALDARTKPDNFSASYTFRVLTPGQFDLRVNSQSLTSPSSVIDVREPGETVAATLTANPTPDFVSRVQREVNSYFDSCTAQQVLLPSGCPFGIQLDNRVVGKPEWTVSRYPVVDLVAGPTGWEIVPASMTITFSADIQSLFDGSVSPVVEEVPLTISGSASLSASGDVRVLITRLL